MSNIDTLDFKTFLSNSTSEVFDTMLSMTVEGLDEAQCPETSKKIVGTVGFAGDVTGCMNIHVDKTFAKLITANMLGVELEDIEEDEILDVVGELSNMIGGDIKSRLCDSNLPCSLSIPTTTIGTDFTIETKGSNRHETYAFHSGEHIALVEVYVKLNN